MFLLCPGVEADGLADGLAVGLVHGYGDTNDRGNDTGEMGDNLPEVNVGINITNFPTLRPS